MGQKFVRNLGIVLMPSIVFLLSADIVIVNEREYPPLFEQQQVYKNINASQEVIHAQAGNLLQYLQGQESLQPILLNEKEVRHMADVRQLFVRSYQVLVISSFLAISCLFMSRERRKMIQYGALLTIISIISIITIDFSTLFYQLHILFFDNDLWLLNPATDNLIKMYPQEIFQALATKSIILALVIAGMALTISLYKPRKEGKV